MLEAGRWGGGGAAMGGNRVRGGGSGWGSRGLSADLSQLHAWLPMLTLTLTRQRGDTCRPAGARVYEHVHAHAHAGIYSHSHVHTSIYSICQCAMAGARKLHTLYNGTLTKTFFKKFFFPPHTVHFSVV